jgi:tetratricopeptide (TPR) repeat protein
VDETNPLIEQLKLEANSYASSVDHTVEEDLAHANTCRQLAQRLLDEDRLAEAMQYFQDATDTFGRLPGHEAEALACAQEIMQGIHSLWRRPEDRLYLLIERINREKSRLVLEPETEARQGDCAVRIATIFQRRDRFVEAESYYREAVSLYGRSPESTMEEAVCHHRLAGLYHHELNSLDRAEFHYAAAAMLYAECESEFEGEQMNRRLCESLLADVKSLRSSRT